MKRRIQTCARDGFGVSCITNIDGPGVVAQPTRHFSGTHRFQKCELHGRVFANSDAAFEAMRERGYTVDRHARESVVSPVFAGLAHVREQAAFDALYRYYRWRERNRLERTRLAVLLTAQAKSVGIFHPVAHHINERGLS